MNKWTSSEQCVRTEAMDPAGKHVCQLYGLSGFRKRCRSHTKHLACLKGCANDFGPGNVAKAAISLKLNMGVSQQGTMMLSVQRLLCTILCHAIGIYGHI